jgi:hypothetical protein
MGEVHDGAAVRLVAFRAYSRRLISEWNPSEKTHAEHTWSVARRRDDGGLYHERRDLERPATAMLDSIHETAGRYSPPDASSSRTSQWDSTSFREYRSLASRIRGCVSV